MKKFLFIFTALILPLCTADAFEIVYPKSKNVTINSDKTFFIGNEKITNLKINGERVKIHPSGGFKYAVNLAEGENKFVIDNGKQKQIYTVNSNTPVPVEECAIIEFEQPIVVTTTDKSTILRSVPVNEGLNRLAHLPEGVDILAIAEYADFYKVQLARDDFGWVQKSQVKTSEKDFLPAVILSRSYENNEDYEVYTFKTDGKKVPYVLSENKTGFDLFIYGLNDNIHPYGKYGFTIPHDGKNFGYSSYFDSDNNLTVKINKYEPSLKNLNITLDAGHGGGEYGAIGCLGDKEKDVNLKIAKKLKAKLETAGARVYMTREEDKSVGLNERVDITNKNDSRIFISIHNNALPDNLADREVTGSEVYYFYPQAKELAKEISQALSAETGMKTNGAKGASFAVIRNTNAVSVLVECAYMIVPEDDAKLQEDEFLDHIADGIMKGLENYLK